MPNDEVDGMTSRMVACLRVLTDGTPRTPNDIGYSLPSGDAPTPRMSKNGRQMGAGSLIVSTLRGLERRGYIAWSPRPDGRSGTAYRITGHGRDALRRNRRHGRRHHADVD